jgi:hypothetical protein
MIRVMCTIVVAFLLLAVSAIVGYSIHLRLGQVSLAAWGSYLTGAGTIGLALAAFVAGLKAVKEYADRTKAEQIRWVGDIFERFFQDKLYRRVRQRVDYDDLDNIAILLERNKDRNAEFSQEERDLLDEFTDYLNFFEFIAFLIAKKQMASEDVSQMFDYYLRRLNQIKQRAAVMEYLEKDGFENLRKLLLQYKSNEGKQLK